ncbi:MAG: biosynthetic arginine decarboxylase [Bacteroidetes bacterium]|nr:biosynthetic arginine decarboxylase [Bacteroidota bacterium]
MNSKTSTVPAEPAETTPHPDAEVNNWSVDDAKTLYNLDKWGEPYFGINANGNVTVRPTIEADTEIAIYDVIEEVRRRGIQLPVLIRFQDLLRRRVIELNESFRRAIEEFEYNGEYQGVYPIKVNQLHEVVLEIMEAGEPYNFGLECGSKAELFATLPHLERDSMLLICNGYKDATMLRAMLMGRQLGKNILPILEKYKEFEDLLAEADAVGVEPAFGVRVRLATAGTGRWAESGGDVSKFGISIPDTLKLIEVLRQRGSMDSFRLVHFHIGSQITDIMALKSAVREATRIYAKLVKMGLGIRYIDVGGGLGINYDSPEAGLQQSINYTLQEYVNSVVYTIKEICDNEGVPHPILVSESGRALTAHHSVLVVGVLSATKKGLSEEVPVVTEKDQPTVRELYDMLTTLEAHVAGARGIGQRKARYLETYHDAVEKRRESDQLFSLGYFSLEDKGKAEQLYWSLMQALYKSMSQLDPDSLPSDLYHVEEQLVDQYLCDFSVFQSMLDHWAIDQLFPVMPIHRLHERPTRRGTLVDITCDSDGKVDQFIGDDGERSFLELHPVDSGNYYLGFFLMGAYQDILGDMHNLFGRVNEVHVYADEEEPGNFYIEKAIRGTTVTEALSQVQYFPSDLMKRMDALIREKVKSKKLRPTQGVAFTERYARGLEEYTYYNFWDESSKSQAQTAAAASPAGTPAEQPHVNGSYQNGSANGNGNGNANDAK